MKQILSSPSHRCFAKVWCNHGSQSCRETPTIHPQRDPESDRTVTIKKNHCYTLQSSAYRYSLTENPSHRCITGQTNSLILVTLTVNFQNYPIRTPNQLVHVEFIGPQFAAVLRRSILVDMVLEISRILTRDTTPKNVSTDVSSIASFQYRITSG